MEEVADESDEETPSIWPVFGDLMACLFGLFVLFFTWTVMWQVDLARDLQAEKNSREAERQRLEELESALAGPLASGRITLVDGRIGIRGSVLFAINATDLARDGRELLRDIAEPLRVYLTQHDEMLMVSGFTDDLAIHGATYGRDNWQLSADRAVTVVRALAGSGIPENRLFAAGFGQTYPVVPNDSSENRARNRRVELAPVPRREKGTR
jgi:flagellar motor protein MotB